MKGSNRSILFAAFLGALGGAGATYLAMREVQPAKEHVVITSATDPPSPGDDPFADTTDTKAGFAGLDDPFAGGGWMDRLEKLGGVWISADGQQTAELDFRTLRFRVTRNWPDIENQTYLLGREMQFLSKDGFYSVCVNENDSLRIIKKDLVTEDHSGFTLYREGSPQARSREPLGEVTPPPVIQRILEEIPNIREGERKDAVMGRIELGSGKIEVLDSFSSLGETDMLIGLGIDNHWMLKLKYKLAAPDSTDSEATILRFQFIRGDVDEARKGNRDIEHIIYPYYYFGKIVTAPATAEQAGADQPATKPADKVPTKDQPSTPTPEDSPR